MLSVKMKFFALSLGRMQEMSTKMQVQWRRAKVLELSSQGYTQSEISKSLQVDESVISRDRAYLRQGAQENLKTRIQDKLPEEYQNCMTGINRVLQLTWEIAEKPTDDKTRLQAFAQLNEGYKFKMDLTTNGIVVTDAIKYVQGQMDHLNKSEKALPQDIKQKEDKEPEQQEEEDIEQQKTTNRIF